MTAPRNPSDDAQAVLDAVKDATERGRLAMADVVELQRGLGRTFNETGLRAHHDVWLDGHAQVHFLIHRVGVHVTTAAEAPERLLRRLNHYADSPKVRELVVVTTDHVHRALVPLTVRGIPCTTVLLATTT